ncbi:sodium/hydrogen exchanger 8 isoform X1 [Amaranthus tricolor]|uniref:sodium/hydrogen exchanger 8 isoform X1 n=1 Tax=Amaranthus tricolor TaxID=29722 RepID=UPI00258EE3FB|nr:sodium/hydrogen exchanger 8 isoform X1 [Amaranthus tricolor]
MAATRIEVPIPFTLTEVKATISSSNSTISDLMEESSSNPTDAVIFFGVSLVLGIACRHFLRGTRVPYTVALLIIGIGLGSLEYGTKHGAGRFGDGIRIWESINPELLLAVFLPALLFESSFSMEIHQIKRCMAQMVLLAGPGVLVSTFCLGTALKLSFPYDWNWKTSLLLGGLLSATDPVAVVALLKELGASKKLSTIIEGESLMNDGTAIVVYQLFFQMALGRSFSWAATLKFLIKVSLGAVGMGIAFGALSVLWLGYIFNDTVIEITLTLAVSYVAYFTAQEGSDVSGVLTVMTLGMFFAAAARTTFKGESQQSLHHFWGMVAYIANTLIFILSGAVIAQGVLSSDNIFENHGISWGYLILLYAYVQVSRVVVVVVLFPFLRYFGYGLDWREAIILIWSGLRGAVALSLSLSVKSSSSNQGPLSLQTGTLFVFFTGGIVILTLIINGSTTQFILHYLGMDKLSKAKRRVLDFTQYEMEKKALEAFGDLGEDEELGPTDWPTVKRYIKSLSISGERIHPHDASESSEIGGYLDLMNLKDMRVRLLNGVQAAYWVMLDEGRITQATASILMQSVDEALDLVDREPLCDWKGLKQNVHFPNYYRFLQRSIYPKKLVTFFTVERLESACYICAAFLRAHRIARRQLHGFIGDSDISTAVINESEAEGEEARKFLEDVRTTFPQVLRVVKTRQVTHAVLQHLIDYVQSLEKAGLLEEKEMLHLHDAVQTDLKRLLRHPPTVKIPKVGDLVSTHPFLGALPATVRELLVGSTKEEVKVRGMTLYKEGGKPSGIWLISNGVVKWASKNRKNKHSLHPTFTHGSTLGLYEVLIGKPYFCDMITDSVAVCFFVEAEKILSALGSDSAVEHFFWKESIIVLAKVLLPQVFESLSLQDMRMLAAERSTLNTYLRGETVEVPPHSIGFLLEGYIKSHSFVEELITSPAVMWPARGNSSFLSQESSGHKSTSFSHRGTSYSVETRARVILMDMATLQADSTLPKRKSSLSLHEQSSRSLTREHGSLLSWPEHHYNSHQHLADGKETDENRNNFSAKAMQLSMFGSTVRDAPLRTRSFQGYTGGIPSHIHSYPQITVGQDRRPLTSAKSEGSTTVRKRLEEEVTRKDLLPPSHTRKPSQARDDSSSESGGEDDFVVKIDSPSNLSFRQAP